MTGLNTDFPIVGGKFGLASSYQKSFNEIWFLINFDLMRTYLEDFSPGLEALNQKSGSYLLQNQVLILGNLTKTILKYVSQIKITGSSLNYGLADRKQFFIAINHTFLPTGTKSTAVAFIGG